MSRCSDLNKIMEFDICIDKKINMIMQYLQIDYNLETITKKVLKAISKLWMNFNEISTYRKQITLNHIIYH